MKGKSFFSLILSGVILGDSSSPSWAQITIKLPAINGCVDSGIDVSIGQSIQFSAIGQASYGYEGQPVNSTPLTNPDGDRFVNGINIGKKNDPNALYPGPIGSLVGRVGLTGNYFFIGSGNQLSMTTSGRLTICYNDINGGFNNNSGTYTVTIYL